METIGRDLREMQRVPLTAEHVAALRETARAAQPEENGYRYDFVTYERA